MYSFPFALWFRPFSSYIYFSKHIFIPHININITKKVTHILFGPKLVPRLDVSVVTIWLATLLWASALVQTTQKISSIKNFKKFILVFGVP